MASSASPKMPTNEGMTDMDRGQRAELPVGTRMVPAGRELSRGGKLRMVSNDASAEGLIRKVPGRGAALNGLSEG